MNHTLVSSSNIYSIGHDDTGLEVRFHARGCKGSKGCDCNASGDLFHYPDVPPVVFQTVSSAPSVGAAFHQHVKAAKHPDTGALLYPGVKRPALEQAALPRATE